MTELSLQEKYAPQNACFGCGPSNEKGLKIRSFPKEDEVVATFIPEPYHQAFPNILNGGIIGTLLDCHSNWTAAYYLMKNKNETTPPCTVTKEFSIKLLRPTPMNVPIELSAKVVEIKEDRASIFATLTADGKKCATCEGVFVSVKPDHPAYHRW